MAKKKKKERKRKSEPQKLSLKLIDEQKNKIVRLIQREEYEKVSSQLQNLEKKLENNPELLAQCFTYIAEKTSERDGKIYFLNEAGVVLDKSGQHEAAIDKYEQALKIDLDYNDAKINSVLRNYGFALDQLGRYDEAIEKFEQALKINPNDIDVLSDYGLTLDNSGRYDEAIEKFEQALKINPEDVKCLNNYGLALDNSGRYNEAIEKYKQALKINPDAADVLSNYGASLNELGKYEAAIEKLEKALKINPYYITALDNYGLILNQLGRYEKAIDKLEEALKITTKNTRILSHYGMVLANLSKYDEAIEKFKQALVISPDNSVALFLCSSAVFEKQGKFEDAISMLEQIKLDTLPQNQSNLIHLNLGRLYFITKSETLGNKHFELAIENSQDKDAEQIKIAKHIFSVSPYSEDAIDRLRQITKDSPSYAQALKLLSLNLFGEDYYKQFNIGSADELKDTEALTRGIYHKMINEISILKGILYEIDYKYQATDSFVKNIIEGVEDILTGINLRRDSEKKKVHEIPSNDYQRIIDIISSTAQDISDFVNNELFGLKSDIQFIQEDVDINNPVSQKLVEVVEQIEYAESALNDLKSVHQGIKIRRSTFKIKRLFETWQDSPKFKQATINLNIQNEDDEFYGDEYKIRGFLNELVENSVKYNDDKANLKIVISSKIANDPMSEKKTMTIIRKYLLITFTDNGKGIPEGKKDWIFLPLKTTSEQGSGLGLFLIKRTLNQMGGYINENGINGANFEIYIPYKGEES